MGRATIRYIFFSSRVTISIHALHGEGDMTRWENEYTSRAFQSTPSTGRATRAVDPLAVDVTISIHALHGEGDSDV